ncbi:MAG: efflux RND transporter permease subunit, partial [Gammaproteobacteria bacterium]|nr:efflux RND transporter permease subunit [Gammaproteobacteria bacterium]
MSERLGFSGAIARKFLQSQITPLLALVGFLLGLFAVAITPREEEPQINVTFANVFVPFPGATAVEVEHLVTTPAEQVLSEIEGVKHIYSVSRPGMAVLTVEYEVGEDRTQAIVRLYNAVFSNQDWLPPNLGTLTPIIKPKGIDDVPIVTATLWTQDPEKGALELQQVAHAIEAELKRIPGTREIYTLGGPDRVVHVLLDAQKLAGANVSLDELRTALTGANQVRDTGALVNANQEILVRAGDFLSSVEDVGQLVIAVRNDMPVYLQDLAEIRFGAATPERYVWHGTGPALPRDQQVQGEVPAVTIAVGKKPGTNAVGIATQVVQRLDELRGTFIPDGVNVTITRDYGETANDKARTLISKLAFATALVVLLVLVALGWREAIIVGLAVLITLAITLFASWAWGFTLNRVSLFALIFSIGILVDDAIVVVENIHRHMQIGGRSLVDAIPRAVDEVGGPTILATFTVIAALLPMAFVSGLMGPYMSPIPINASIGMLISLAVAFVFTPWLTFKLIKVHAPSPGHDDGVSPRLLGFFQRRVGPFLGGAAGAPRRRRLALVILVLILLSLGLAGAKWVVLKMLPFDNKSEFQILVDMPEGTALERTTQVLGELGQYLRQVPEVRDYQAYAGISAPINFNGLVRQYYLRSGAHVGDLQVNLVDKHHRDRKSHEIASAMRAPLQEIGRRFDANVKIVEVPPGPPVLSPLVAEVYGLDYPGQIRVAKALRGVFESTTDIVDVDDSVESPAPQLHLHVDRVRAGRLGISQAVIVDAITTVLSGSDVTYLHSPGAKYAVPLRLQFPVAERDRLDRLFALKLTGQGGRQVALADLVSVEQAEREHAIYHKDMLPMVMVTGDMAGSLDSPLYGMFEMVGTVSDTGLAPAGGWLEQYFVRQPDNPYRYSIKWDGEWQVTYETFRDMGIAYSVGLVLIYLLVVAQFRSYLVPLIIMAPIPLTVIGVMPGHALLGAPFTATSMIGMIALAGIIVRNSILLVDFVNQEVQAGVPFEAAVLRSGAVRAKPIILTGLAAMLGALFILDD